MSFPGINLDAALGALKQVFAANGVTSQFDLLDGTSFTIMTTDGHLRDSEVTEGLNAGAFKLRVLASDWDVASPGRPPRKGDQVTRNGRRHAVEAYHLRAMADTPIMYVMTVQG